MRRVAGFAVVPLLMLVVVACGDDEETLTTEAFLEQADTICEAATTEIDDALASVYGPSGEEPTPEQQAAFVADTLAPLLQGEIDDLEALNPPEDLQDNVEQWLADAQTVLDGITEDPTSLFGPEAEDLFTAIDAQAGEIGLTSCAGDEG